MSIPHSEFRIPHSVREVVVQIVDAHVHFWDPTELRYPWLEGVPALHRAYLPSDYAAATAGIAVTRLVFVEANCRPEEAQREVALVERLAQAEPRIAGVVAFADVSEGLGARGSGLGEVLNALSRSPLVKGIRQNIQGRAAGFCLRPAFVAGVQEVGRRGFTFDLCATHDQLPEVTELVEQCPDTRLVLDHCGKPAIRDRSFEPWSACIARLATHDNVYCKLSGLLTEAAAPEREGAWCEEDLLPYATRVVDCFGTERVMYGSDWPVVTQAGEYRDWYGFTERFTARWSATERDRFFGDNAARVYGL